MSFWDDVKVVEDFTPEDRYFYLYLMTNPHTNLCGCYELGKKQMSSETGYSLKVVEELLKRFEHTYSVIRYSEKTKEILLVNWYKYNWTTSETYLSAVKKDVANIKDKQFKEFLNCILNGENTVPIPYTDCIDTSNTISNTISNDTTKKEKEIFPPTVEMVRAYVDEMKYSVDAQSFIDFYESKGWYVGKNKMKDWKAAVRTWEQRNKKDGTKKQKGWLFNE